MTTHIRIFERTVDFTGPVVLDGCSLKIGGVKVLSFTNHETGYCSSCFYTEPGVEISDAHLAQQFGIKRYESVPLSHVRIELDDTRLDEKRS